MQGVGKSRGKRRSQEIDIQLQIAAGVTAEDRQIAATLISRAYQVKTDAPSISKSRGGEAPWPSAA